MITQTDRASGAAIPTEAKLPIVFDAIYSPAEAAQLLGLSKANIYKLVAAGRIRAARIGRRTLIPGQSLLSLIDSAMGEV